MNIEININGLKNEIVTDIRAITRQKLNDAIDKAIEEIDLNKIITELVTEKVNYSHYVTDSMIRNLVQERIAKLVKLGEK